VLTAAIDPGLQLKSAERIFLFDRQTGTILIADSFAGSRALKFATHLHCSGSAKEVEPALYRLTGGQAERIAGLKHGAKGLGNEEKGALYVQLLRQSAPTRVVVEEPDWIPGYIYGLNYTGKEEMKDGVFPRYTRWRLEVLDRVFAGELVFAISPEPHTVNCSNGRILLPQAGVCFGPGIYTGLGVTADCEGLLWEDNTGNVTAMGAIHLEHEGCRLQFALPVDLEYSVASRTGSAFATSSCAVSAEGFQFAPWSDTGAESAGTQARWRTEFRTAVETKQAEAR
jgi:hypothetical protein